MAYHHGNLRAALLTRATAVVAESGVEGLSLRSLARDLEVSHNAPRKHFADRAELLAAVATDGCFRAIDRMRAAADDAGLEPLERLRAMATAYIRFAIDEPAIYRAINHPEVWRSTSPEMKAALRSWIETVRTAAIDAQAAGWRRGLSQDAVVASAISAAVGAAEVLSQQSWTDLLDGAAPASLIDQVVDQFLVDVDQRIHQTT